MLAAIFTGYPRWKLGSEGIPPQRIRCFPWVQTLALGLNRFGLTNSLLDRELTWLAQQTLDHHCARRMPECDVFVGLSSSGLASGLAAQRTGARFICDRGSSHIRIQHQILTDEFQRWGQSFPGIDPRIVEKEEREYAAADLITVPSRFARDTFVQKGIPADRLRIIPYGVSLEKFQPSARPPAQAFNVVAAGQVSFRKGVPFLLEAFSRLRHPAKSLTLAGTLTREIKPWLKNARLSGVRFPGHLGHPELANLFSRSHVLVLASVEDGFGLVLAQAMACGCPCIATNTSGGPDLISDGVDGFVVPARDPIAIHRRLEQLAQDSTLRDRMSVAALAKVRSFGGWREYGDTWANLCTAIAGQKPSCS